MLQRMSTFFTGVFCGAAVGAVVTLILTPGSGQELRLRSRQHVQQAILDSAKAADARRQQLQAELAAKTALPENS